MMSHRLFRRLSASALCAAVLLAGSMPPALAQTTSTMPKESPGIFETFYAQSDRAAGTALISRQAKGFVIEAMKKWNRNGVLLDEKDIDYAMLGNLEALCGGTDTNTHKLVDAKENPLPPLTYWGCGFLQADILKLVNQARQDSLFADDLLSLTAIGGPMDSGAGRPIDIGHEAATLASVLTGTGKLIPWPFGDQIQKILEKIKKALTKDEEKSMIKQLTDAKKSDPLSKALEKLDGALGGQMTATDEDPDLPDRLLACLSGGIFRLAREKDPDCKEFEKNDVVTELQKIAALLGITGDVKKQGEFATPKLDTPNLALWANRADIGVAKIFPDHVALRYEEGTLPGKYPEPFKRETPEEAAAKKKTVNNKDEDPPPPSLADYALNLRSPFSYKGKDAPDPEEKSGIRSAYCSRGMNGDGFVCRRPAEPFGDCKTLADQAGKDNKTTITLLVCEQHPGSTATAKTTTAPSTFGSSSSAFRRPGEVDPKPEGVVFSTAGVAKESPVTSPGPHACDDLFASIYKDDKKSLLVSEGSTTTAGAKIVDPKAKPESPGSICNAENKVRYVGDITNTACYISACLIQSMTTHTLVPGRNAVTVMEQAAPMLGLLRPDPALGSLLKMPRFSGYAPPPYIGHYLFSDVIRDYCNRSGMDHPLPGVCATAVSRLLEEPSITYASTTEGEGVQQELLAFDQSLSLLGAPAAGQRTALNQWWPLYEHIFNGWAAANDSISQLVTELNKAPLTKTMCPATGPLPNNEKRDGKTQPVIIQ